jgi:hypothetical protein
MMKICHITLTLVLYMGCTAEPNDPSVTTSETETSPSPSVSLPGPSVDLCTPNASVKALQQQVKADGEDTVWIQLDIECLSDPVLHTSAGSLSPILAMGRSHWSEFTAGNLSGDATITLTSKNWPPVSTTIAMSPGEPVGMQLHLHGPISEGDQTHDWANSQAIENDVAVIWWTDHDYRYDFDLFQFVRRPNYLTSDALQLEIDEGTSVDWFDVSASESAIVDLSIDYHRLFDGEPTLALVVNHQSSPSMTEMSLVEWTADRERLYRPLLSDVTLKFALFPSATVNPAHIRVIATLSKVNTEEDRRIVFVDPSDIGFVPLPNDYLYMVNFPKESWSTVEVNLSDYALSNLPEGVDTTLRKIEFVVETTRDTETTINIGGLSISEEVCCEELMDVQREHLAENFSGAVEHLVGQEVSYESGSDRHLLAFGSDVPLYSNYDIYSLANDAEIIMEEIAGYGALIGLAHPLVGLGNVAGIEDVAARCETLSDVNVYHSELIEVGYIFRGGSFTQYLELWDCLSGRGHLLTGIGVSDVHENSYWDSLVNSPFITYPRSHGATEADYLNALRSGDTFIGNQKLILFKSPDMELMVVEHPSKMGQVLNNLAPEPITLLATINAHEKGDEVRWIVNGKQAGSDAKFASSYTFEVTPTEWNWVRVEVWRKEEAVLISNPIYLSTVEVDAPSARAPRP